ncbi:MAG: hypothetical protein R3B54_02240 [Bdellovibrionota bacterium]
MGRAFSFGFILSFVAETLLTAAAVAKPTAFIGKIPGEYLEKDAESTVLGYVLVDDRLIQRIEEVDDVEETSKTLKKEGADVLVLKPKGSRSYDVIYPGLIDLHGHNKQNMLPTWDAAKGQFANRFEWRKKVANYQQVQSDNMNPWSSKTEAQVAAYRWSELQAMVLGTAYLQGHMLNHKNLRCIRWRIPEPTSVSAKPSVQRVTSSSLNAFTFCGTNSVL